MDEAEETEVPQPLGPGLTVEAALRAIVRRCSAEIDAHLAFVLDRDEPVGPHKARVWLRRLVTAMDAFAPVLKGKKAAAFRAEAKAIFRALGKLRDSDVLMERMVAQDKGGRLAEAAAALRQKVRGKLRDRNAVLFAPLLLRAVNDGVLFRAGPEARVMRGEPVARLAEAALDVAWEDCCAHRHRIGELPPVALHDFRKDLKTLRYQTEFFAPLLGSDRAEAFRAKLQRMQDLLGVATDAQVMQTAPEGAGKAKGGRRAETRKADRAAIRAALSDAQDIWLSLLEAEPWWRLRAAVGRLH